MSRRRQRTTSPVLSELYNLRHNVQENPEPPSSQPPENDIVCLGTFIPATVESQPSTSADALKALNRNRNKQPALPQVPRTTAQSAHNASSTSPNDQDVKPEAEATQNTFESVRDGAEGEDDIQELPAVSQSRRSSLHPPPPPPIGLLGANNHRNNERVRDEEPLFERRSDLAQRLRGDRERAQRQESSSWPPQSSFFNEVETIDYSLTGTSVNQTRKVYDTLTGSHIIRETQSRSRSPVRSRNFSRNYYNNPPILSQDPPPLRSSNRDVDQWQSREPRNDSRNRNGVAENARERERRNIYGQQRSRSRSTSRGRRNSWGSDYGSPTRNDADRSRRRGRTDYSRERRWDRDDSDDDRRHHRQQHRRRRSNSEERRHPHCKKHKKSKRKQKSPRQEQQPEVNASPPMIVPTTGTDTNQSRENQNPVNPLIQVTTQGVAEGNGQQQPEVNASQPVVQTTRTGQSSENQNPVNPLIQVTTQSVAEGNGQQQPEVNASQPVVQTTSTGQSRENQNPVNPLIQVTTQGVAEGNGQQQPEVIPIPTAPTGIQNPVIPNNSIPGHPAAAAGGGDINVGTPLISSNVGTPNVPSSNMGANRRNPRPVRTIPASEASILIRTCREPHGCGMKGHVFGTRDEGIQHLTKVHGKELCFVCFKGINKYGPEHRNHVHHEHEDDLSKSVCPIDRCGERFYYKGMYRHQIRKHYSKVEPENPTTSRTAGGKGQRRANRSHSNDEEDEEDEQNIQTRKETSSAQATQNRQRVPTPSTSTNQLPTASTRQPIPRVGPTSSANLQGISPPPRPTTTSRISHENQSRMRTSASNAVPATTTTNVARGRTLNQNQSQRNGTIDEVEENLTAQRRYGGVLRGFKIPKKQ